MLAEAEARKEATEAGRRALVDELEEERAAHALARSELRASEAHLAEARSEAAGHKYEGGVLRLKVEQLEAREKRALEQAENAVELFKESEEFRDMLEEETVDGFLRGFENFRRQMARYCPQYDLSGIRPRSGFGDDFGLPSTLDDEEEADEIEVGGQVAELEAVGGEPLVRGAPTGEAAGRVTETAGGVSSELAAGGPEPNPVEDP